jgi:hypothetical protein
MVMLIVWQTIDAAHRLNSSTFTRAFLSLHRVSRSKDCLRVPQTHGPKSY